MKSASKNWIFFLLTLVLFNCGGSKPQPKEPIIPMEKAYVLLRSEGEENDLTELINILNSDFITNNISTNIVTYPLGKTWNHNQIFSTAYNDKYDYIVLIDQVAKFTIDNRTQVGGKYQIRSYHVKSPNPDWLDLGQKTCNISVKPSIKKFTQQIVSNIVPNYKSSTISFNEDEEYAENSSSSNSGYQSFKSSKEIDDEIEELKNQLKLEKEKTEKVLAEKIQLEKQYEEALAQAKLKTELALTSLELAKKEKAKALVLKNEEETIRKKQRQKEIAESIAAKREEIRKEEVEEALRNPKPVVTVTKEPTREDRLKERQEAKLRIAEEKALARQKQEEEVISSQKARKRLAEEKRNEQKRLKEELINKRKEQKRLAQAKRDQELLDLQKQQEQEERLATLEESKRIEAEKEKERLAKLLKEKQALAEAEKLENKRIEQQKAKEEQKRLTQAKRNQELLELQKQQEEERLAILEETKRIEAEKAEEEKRLEKLLKEEQELAKANLKKENELTIQKLSREEKRLEKEQREEEDFKRQKQLKENRRLAQIEEKASKPIVKAKSKTKKKNSETQGSKSGKLNALVVLIAKKDDVENLKNLQDNIEFDFLFAKAIATTKIYDNESELDKGNIVKNNQSNYDIVIVVNQLDYKGDGYHDYQITKYNSDNNSNSNELGVQSFNISDRASIKQFSKLITSNL